MTTFTHVIEVEHDPMPGYGSASPYAEQASIEVEIQYRVIDGTIEICKVTPGLYARFQDEIYRAAMEHAQEDA